jgi:3-oxoacyl-[acyl-carrier-protein] synthase II
MKPSADGQFVRRPAVCVTGMGIVTSLGVGKQDNWAALTQGKSGIGPIRRFDAHGLRTTIGGTIDFDGLGALPFPVRTERLARMALNEALSEARLSAKDVPAPMFLGIPPTEMSWAHRLEFALDVGGGRKTTYDELVQATSNGAHRDKHQIFVPGGIATRLAEHFVTQNAPVVVNTACATGATVIQLAAEAIRRGEADRALAVAADASIVPDTIIRFSLLAALSMTNDPPDRAARPFSLDRDGFVIGEGAAALVLENYEAAKGRGISPIGFVTGLGESADRYHLTRSSPDASAIASAMRSAIRNAGLAPDDIHYINAHGTGTPENDRVEGLALRQVFGSHTKCPPISSNKSMIGHTMSAAGAIEALFSLLTIKFGTLPPTINYRIPDPELPLDVVPNASRSAAVKNVLSNSFGFGGQNVCLVLSCE